MATSPPPGPSRKREGDTMTELVAIDAGGTHVRFAPAAIAADGAIALGEPVTLNTDDFADPEGAWREFARRTSGPVPRAKERTPHVLQNRW